MQGHTELIVPLDCPDSKTALQLVSALDELPIIFKVGYELFYSAGPKLVETLKKSGKRVFLDLKLYDIPNTVASGVRSLLSLEPELITLHSLGGKPMLEAAQNEVERAQVSTRLLGVTVLTSYSEEDWSSVAHCLGGHHSVSDSALKLAELSQNAGLAGLVCSAWEVEVIRKKFQRAYAVVPGIRPKGSEKGDQARVMTPQEAKIRGASAVVVGRPILRAKSPLEMAKSILNELA